MINRKHGYIQYIDDFHANLRFNFLASCNIHRLTVEVIAKV